MAWQVIVPVLCIYSELINLANGCLYKFYKDPYCKRVWSYLGLYFLLQCGVSLVVSFEVG